MSKKWIVLGILGFVLVIFITFSFVAYNTEGIKTDLYLQNDPENLNPSDYFPI